MVIDLTPKARRFKGQVTPPCPNSITGLHRWLPTGFVPHPGRHLSDGIAAWLCRCPHCRAQWEKPTEPGERMIVTPSGHLTVTRAHLSDTGVQQLDVHPEATTVAIAMPDGVHATVPAERLEKWLAAGCPEPPAMQEITQGSRLV